MKHGGALAGDGLGRTCALCVMLATSGLGCRALEDTLHDAEASDAVVESTLALQALGLGASTIELASRVGAGAEPEAAAQTLATSLGQILACAAVSADGAEVAIDFGAQGGCVVDGHVLTGADVVTIVATDAEGIVVDHSWTDVSDGVVSISGTAEVIWADGASERSVAHDFSWTRVSDGQTGAGTSILAQAPGAFGVAESVRFDGALFWFGVRGEWDLELEGAERRWVDAVPQIGTLHLNTPFVKTVTLGYDRIDESRIAVKVVGTQRSFAYVVNAAGELE